MIKFLRVILKIFWLFPVNEKKIVLTSYNGRLFTCSPKYIAKELAKRKKYSIYYALVKNSKDEVVAGAKRIKYKSLYHFYLLMTAKFIIFNSTGFSSYLPYRKQQVIINTWHGGYSFKVIGNEIFTDKKSKERRKLSGEILTYFLSGSALATEQHSKAMSVSLDKFLNIGLPRNDFLFKNHFEIKNRIFEKFSINNNRSIVLYAPTYRDGPIKSMSEYGLQEIDIPSILNALNEKFDKNFIFMYKAHHDMIPDSIDTNCINASAHSDIQELIYAADVIITDYSSCMSDFALQRKPGFLFTPDLEEYRAIHPFSIKPSEWPYQIARNNIEIIDNIKEYNEQIGLKKIEDFLIRIGNFDNGSALNALIEILDKKIDEI